MNIQFMPLEAIPSAPQKLENLHKIVFGPGRFARSAYRLRENVCFDGKMSTGILNDGQLIGAVVMTPISIGTHKAYLLGPLAVLPKYENQGYGTQLLNVSITAAKTAGEQLIVLVGDAPFYARIGFENVPEGQILFTGPVDPKRLLALALVPNALEYISGKACVFSNG